MGKFGRTFTIDMEVLNWLEQHGKEHNRKVSYIVNAILNTSMRQSQSWECSVCNTFNSNDNQTCYQLTDGDFCKGVKPE